jgi:hypothetical protein
MWMALQAFFGDSSTSDGKFNNEDDHKEVHECVDHDRNLVIVEDCSTSWSSDDDDNDTTTSSLDKVSDDATSDAIDDDTPCSLVDDGSCSGYEIDISTSAPTSPHCFMS